MEADSLARFAAAKLDEIDRDEDLPADAELVDALLIVEVTATDEDGDPASYVHAYVMSERNVAGIGLAMRGLAAMVI